MAPMALLKWFQLTNWRVNILCHPNFTTENSTLSLIAFKLAKILVTNNKSTRDYTKLYVFPRQILLHDQISCAAVCYFDLSACSLICRGIFLVRSQNPVIVLPYAIALELTWRYWGGSAEFEVWKGGVQETISMGTII